jgi:biopolymer transport protein ExbB
MIELLAASFLRLEAFMSAGGPVMAPLAVVSLAMWLLIIDRLLFFRRLNRKNMSFQEAWEHVRDNRPPDGRRYKGVTVHLVSVYLNRRTMNGGLDRFILDEVIQAMAGCLKSHLAVIGVLAAIAPLLGLLGTVLGMIGAFDILAVFGAGNVKAMAGSISEAMITTETGCSSPSRACICKVFWNAVPKTWSGA